MEPRVVHSTNERSFATNKNVPPALQKSNVIDQFSCHCDNWYIGRAFQRLQDIINSTFPNLSALILLPKSAYFLPVGANLPPTLIPSLLLLIQQLDFIFYKILSVLNIMMVEILYSCPRSLFFPSADKKNSCTVQRLRISEVLSLVLFQPITARLCPINSHFLSCTLHSDGFS